MVDELIVAALSFGRNCIGIITRPYETYRRIVAKGSLWELPYIVLLLCFYFAIASIVKTAAFRPFLLTKHFVALALAVTSTTVLTTGLLWQIGRVVGGSGKASGFVLGWAYTLVPTVCWFLATSLLYVVLPPPRTSSIAGVAFSVLFLVFSITLLFWKITLSYLALRFGMRLGLFKIFLVTAITGPILGLYSIWMYRIGIFKVPFL